MAKSANADDAPARTDRWERRLTDIVDRAAEVFARQGYAATGLSDLEEAVNLRRGALYYYIESKENLLSLIHDRVLEEVLASAADVSRLDDTPLDKLRLLSVELVRIITTYPHHVWVFLHEYRALTGERARRFKEKRNEYEDALRTILRDGVEQGQFSLPDEELTVMAWLGMHNYTYIWYRADGDLSPLKLSSVYHHIFTEGILTPAARRPPSEPAGEDATVAEQDH